MKVKKFDSKTLRNDEHFQLNTEVKKLIDRTGAIELNIEPQYNAYMTVYQQEDDVLKKISKSAFTEDLQVLDQRRDHTWRGLVRTNETAVSYHFDPTVVASAKRLKVVFDTYGDVARKPLNEETAAIHNVLQELKGNYARDVRVVQLEDWVDELEANNRAFDQTMTDRFDETAAKPAMAMKEVRTMVDDAYKKITERIESLFVVDENNPVYKEFIHSLNVVIDKYNLILAQRKGRAAAGEDVEIGEIGEDGEITPPPTVEIKN